MTPVSSVPLRKRAGVLLLIGALALVMPVHAQDTLRVLFIGNSMTYVEDLPGLLTNLASSNGKTVITAQRTPGGYFLADHIEDPLSLSLMAQGFDYIVVQEQSSGNMQPALPSPDITRPIEVIDSIAKAHCSKLLLYATPGYPETHPWSNETYEDMQAYIIYNYSLTAQSVRAACLPTAHAFRDVIRNHPGMSGMWASPTDHHPGIKGQYLHACVMYSVLYKESAVGSPAPSGMNESDASLLQQTAWNFANDSALQLGYHFIDTFVTGFQRTIAGSNVLFVDTSSSFIDRIEWDFGDQSGITVSEPVLFQEFGAIEHSYPDTGCFWLKRRLYWGTCENAMDSALICLQPTSVPDAMGLNPVQLHPNPTSGVIHIRSSDKTSSSIVITDLGGRVVMGENTLDRFTTLDISFLPRGVYLVEILNSGGRFHAKVIKE